MLSRADWVSAAVTLIVIAMSYWLGGQKAALICGPAGVLILLMLHFVRKRKRGGSLPAPGTAGHPALSSVRDSGNATIRDSGNASVTQHFHFGEDAAPAQPKVAAERERRRPNVQFVRTSSIAISHDDKRDILYEGGNDAWSGTVALFRNTSLADAEVDDAEYVRAQIIHKNAQGQEIFNAAPACWLENYPETASLDVDVDRSLIMGLVPPGGSLIVLWRESGYSSGPIPDSVVNMKYREFGKDENITTAEVKLVESNRVICGPIVFGLRIVNGQLEVKRL